jgi:NADH dehydrogenase (ubiquinone) 1 beta subcomplex subunit 8
MVTRYGTTFFLLAFGEARSSETLSYQMHEHEELYSMWGPDIAHVAPATALNHFAIALSGFVAFGFLCNYVLTPDRPAVPRQYPFNGLVRELGGLEENKVSFTHLF